MESRSTVLRLPGESAGADIECERAWMNYVPVFRDTDQLKQYFTPRLQVEATA